jgi:hypothetical protein
MAAFQDIDSGGSAGSTSKCFCLEEWSWSSSSWYRRSDPETYHFDIECHRGQFLFIQYASVLPCSDCLWTVSVIAGPSGFIQVESGTGYIRT